MKPIKIKFETSYGTVEFYNTAKGIRDFIILLNTILSENEIPFNISASYEKR